MRRDLSQPCYTLDGTPIVNPDTQEAVPLFKYCLDALMANYKGEEALTGKQKVERYQLALKINKRPKEVDLTSDQLVMLKDLIAKAFGPLIVGQAYEVLEGETLSLVNNPGPQAVGDKPAHE